MSRYPLENLENLAGRSTLKSLSIQGLHATNNMAFRKDFEALQQLAGESPNAGGSRGPHSLPGWIQSAAYSLLLGDSLLSDRTTWGHLWGRQVDLIVTILPSAAKDELALFSRY